MKNLVFACLLTSGEYEQEALRLARSIRTFGGEFCFNPIWLLSRRTSDELNASVRREINSLGLRLVPFEMVEGDKSFPFRPYVTAAAIAESLAQGETSFLVMMASDTLVLQAPYPFLLPYGKNLGACPVHLKNLGPGYLEPLDEFWQLIYRECNVLPEQVFEMQSIVDDQPIRPYFNAGMLVVRPERGFLRHWQASFERLHCLSGFDSFYQKDELYPIYMHQAVLAGSLIASLKPGELLQLPFQVNYPLHLHSSVDLSRRPANLGELVTCRYEDFVQVFGNPGFYSRLQVDHHLKDWLEAELGLINPSHGPLL